MKSPIYIVKVAFFILLIIPTVIILLVFGNIVYQLVCLFVYSSYIVEVDKSIEKWIVI